MEAEEMRPRRNEGLVLEIDKTGEKARAGHIIIVPKATSCEGRLQ